MEYERGACVPAMPTVSLPHKATVFKRQEKVKDVEERGFGGAEGERGWVWQCLSVMLMLGELDMVRDRGEHAGQGCKLSSYSEKVLTAHSSAKTLRKGRCYALGRREHRHSKAGEKRLSCVFLAHLEFVGSLC